MKNSKIISFLIIVVSSFLFIQCTSDPIPGPAGANGANGVNGTNGVDGTTSCVECHSNAHRDVIKAQYAISNHATAPGNSWARGTSASCAQCHNNQGFIDFQSNGGVDPAGYATSTAINCTGCHDKDNGHRSFDFATDGNDYALRTLDPVQLIIDPTVTIDSKNSSDLLGYSNTCANCHQPRTPAPTDDGTGTYAITSSHWGPHHGPQSTMLQGLGGAYIAGSTAYPGVGAAAHAKGASCVACHMGDPSEATNGGHTWNPTENTCLECHTTVPTEVSGLADDQAALLAALQAKGVFDANGGLVTGTYPVKVAQAAFNYIYVQEDRSNGIHNPAYAKALIENATESLNALP